MTAPMSEIDRLRRLLADHTEAVADALGLQGESDIERLLDHARMFAQDALDIDELRAELAESDKQAARDAALVGLVLAEGRAAIKSRRTCNGVPFTAAYEEWREARRATLDAVWARIEQEDQ